MHSELKQLKKPSEYYNTLVKGLNDKLKEVEIKSYAKFNYESVEGIQAYIEISGFNSGSFEAQGRNTQHLKVDIHCLVSEAVEDNDLRAMDLASAIAIVAHNNFWGLGDAVEAPENIHANEGMAAKGSKGFEGWLVSFSQTVYLGEPAPIEPAVKKVSVAVNSQQPEKPDEYEPVSLEVENA